jgi:hypothetical protein
MANLSGLVLVALLAIVLGYDAGKGNERLGVISKTAAFIGQLPHELAALFKTPPYVRLASEVPAFNELEEDVFAVHTFGPSNEAILVNLRTDSIHRRWNLGDHKPFPNSRYFALLLPDSSLLAYVHEGDWIGRFSPEGELLWEEQGQRVYHHSAEILGDDLWICGRDLHYLYQYGKSSLDTFFLNEREAYPLIDEHMVLLDWTTGKVKQEISMTELFEKNQLNPILNSAYGPAYGDAFHLNDIQPVTFTDTIENFAPGDLLVSNRTQNALLHVRPSTREILHTYKDGLYSQHDVDIWGDSLIVCFNNRGPSLFELSYQGDFSEHQGIYSQLGAFDLKGNPIGMKQNAWFENEHLYSSTEGLTQLLPGGYLCVEEQNNFTIYVFKDGILKYRGGLNYFASPDYVEIPNWTQFLSHP